MTEDQFEAGAYRIHPRAQAGMAAGEAFLDQDALVLLQREVEHRFFALLVEVVGDHGAIALFQRQQPAVHRLAGQAEGADLAGLLQLGEGLVDAAVPQYPEVVAVGMHQHQVDEVGFQAFQASFDGEARVFGAEVEAGNAAVEFLAHLADDHPVLTLAAQ
ncbi:hypothetical protein FQZ97_694050 [compost metagenome]